MIMTLHAAVACGSQGSLPSSVRSFHEVKEKTENVELEGISADYGKLAKELEKASPLAAINKAFLQKFRNGSAFSFSEADDVSLILQSVVSSQDTGSLNSQNYKLLDGVEKYYGIDIKYMHQECCQVAKVRPLRRALEDLCAWITGQRKDQSPGTRTSFPVLQIDPSFEGHGDGTISLVKWNPGENLGGHVKWNFLETMDVPVNSLHALGYVSTGCETFTRPAFPWQHKREGRWCWEEGEVKECGLRKGNIESEDAQLNEHINGVVSFTNVNDPIADVFNSQNLISLSRTGMEILSALENRTEPWLDVLYAPWRGFCQAMEGSYLELAAKLVNAKVKIGKLRVDGEHKAFAKQKLQLRSFTTTVIFPTSRSIKYSSEKRDIDSQLAFVNSLQW